MLISEYLKLKKELKKELLREKLKKEIQQNSVFENNIFDFFDLVRSGNLGETDIYKSLKDLTDNFNIENLNHTLKDLEFYLFDNREEMISQFDYEEIMKKIDERTNKGLEIPYIKFSDSKNQTKEQREKMEKAFANRKNPFLEKIIDVEALMFPYEFFNLYKLKNIISKKIKEEINLLGFSNNTNQIQTENEIPELEVKNKVQKSISDFVNFSEFEIEKKDEIQKIIINNFTDEQFSDFIYLVENFEGNNKRFSDLTKFNQIYYYFYDIKIPHSDYKRLVKLIYDFDYNSSEIKGENEKHQKRFLNIRNLS